MPRYFLDSSALVKRYHQESGSSTVEALFNESGNRFVISRLAIVELHSAFARLVREGTLSESNFSKLVARIDADVASGLLAVVAVSGRRLEAASAILRAQGLKEPICTLDAIHLATVHAVHNRRTVAAFVAADQRLLASAGAAGFTVLDVSP